MSKYTGAEIQRMARVALAARTNAPDKWLQLQLTLSMRTGINPHQIERRIKEMAR